MPTEARSETRPHTVTATIVGAVGLWSFLTGGVFLMVFTLPFAVVLAVFLFKMVFSRPSSFAELRYQRTLVTTTAIVIVATDLLLLAVQTGALI